MILFPRLHFNMMTRSKAMAAPRPRGAACEDKNTRLKKAIICMKAQELKAKRAEVVKQVEKNGAVAEAAAAVLLLWGPS